MTQYATPILASTPIHTVGTGGFIHPETVVNSLDIQEGMKIADFGCGAGYFTILLAEKTGSNGRVYALDVLENALDNVRARARANNLDNIETVRTNLEVLGSSSLVNESQDIVLLANILFQSNKDENIIKEAARVLKKDGGLVVIDWQKGADGFGPPDSLRRSQEDIKKMVEKIGLKFGREFRAGSFHFGLIFKKG